MLVKIRFREDSTAGWTTKNPVLQRGEPGWDYNAKVLKVGDAVTPWNTLDVFYAVGSGATVADADIAAIIEDLGSDTRLAILNAVAAEFTSLTDEEIATLINDTGSDVRIALDALYTSGGATDHGALTGLADDDHPQYHNNARGDARYSQLGHNHTSGQVTDFTEAVQDVVGSLLAAGTGVTVSYNDAGNTLTISASTGDAEFVRDTVGAALVAGTGVSVTVNDAGDTITIAVSGLTIANVSGLQAALDAKAPTANPTFTGTVSGVTKTHVGLGNVDNTSDANKPVSTATQTALNAKADADGTSVYIQWDGSNWRYKGTVVSARPTLATYTRVVFVDLLGSSTWPAWATADLDIGLKAST